MRKYGYSRPSSTLYVRRRRPTTRKKPSSFPKFFVSLLLIVVACSGLWLAGRYAWRVFSQAQFADWHVKTVSVDGITGPREEEIFAKAAVFQDKSFSAQEGRQLQNQLAADYPLLTDISVSRGFLSGRLTVSVKHREPVAQFVLPDGSVRYVDRTSTVYTDPDAPEGALPVELNGAVPEKVPGSFVELVQSMLKLKKTLPFEALSFDVTDNTVIMRLPDQSVICFGPAEHLKEKVARAEQILAVAKEKYSSPVKLDFKFFDQGKVFLTQ